MNHTVNGRAPSHLQDLIPPSASVPRRSTLRSAIRPSHHDLVMPSSHQKVGNRAFYVAVCRAWNSLSIELKTITRYYTVWTSLFTTACDLFQSLPTTHISFYCPCAFYYLCVCVYQLPVIYRQRHVIIIIIIIIFFFYTLGTLNPEG